MNKQQFLEKLKNRLVILSDSEVKDILDEYSDTIDQKIQEGMTEEDAVKDFGDIDELANEILEAYKINTSKKSARPDDTAQKVGNALNEIVDYLVKFFSTFFRDLSVEGVTRTLVLIGVAIVLIFVLQIPFYLIRSLVRSLLEVILPYGIGHAFSIVTSVLLSIVFFVLTVLIIISFVRVGVNGEEINAENLFKRPLTEGFKFDEKTSNKEHNTKKEEPLHANEKRDEATYVKTEKTENKNEKEAASDSTKTESKNKDYSYSYSYDCKNGQTKKEKSETNGFGNGIITAFVWILRFIAVCFLIPFWGIIVGIAIALGFLVYLWIIGVPLLGLIFISIGALGLIGAIVGGFTNLIFNRRHHFWSIGASLIISALFLGIGVPLTFNDIANLEPVYITSQEATRYFGKNEQLEETIPYYENAIYDFNDYDVKFVLDDSLHDKLVVESNGSEFLDIDYYQRGNDTYQIYIYQDFDSFRGFRNYFINIVEAMKDKKILVFDSGELQITVRVPAAEKDTFQYYDRFGNLNTLNEKALDEN